MNIKFINICLSLFVLFIVTLCPAQVLEKNLAPSTLNIDYKASPRPDRILLTLTKDPSREIMITWRTNNTITKGISEIAKVEKEFDFYKNAIKKNSTTTTVTSLEKEQVVYHKVKFSNLIPNTLYAYRVGDGTYWSEWIQFKTSEEEFEEPFQILYLGDAQNDIFTLWSKVIRGAFKKAPNARFSIHAGDLINHSQNNYEWGEWFEANSFIPKMMPVLATLGNHEYVKDSTNHKVGISNLWDPQFNFPNNGPKGFEDRTYYVDYLNTRIICLDSNEGIKKQSAWLEKVLQNHKQQWVIAFFHHPVISAARGRANEDVLRHWKPLFDMYKVDLVLQGHDHVYGRGNKVNSGLGKWNENSGTTYVVSVSGRKMYSISDHPWMDKKGKNIQLYQVITVDNNILNFKAYTLDDELFDHFELMKKKNHVNILKELPLKE
ncbi:metallophosphoesterase family protein [Aquimarina gracilis]|uniref:Metallophosphoesterase family protein n=1 Tax=Aquimarina gracilis TaxID=874422 RepID=A0ABU5ZNZ1_9FLAO|nr:metallophosphoesterase family protein [Aquimarina gracilis]MEB3343873.1 metallophosphoesterase family protein [Aquimarina gracilis]